jgi:hypothetical protein
MSGPQDTAIALFIGSSRQMGLTIVETIKRVCVDFDIPLAQAKEMVSTHPSWRSIVSAAEPLHDTVEQTLLKSSD